MHKTITNVVSMLLLATTSTMAAMEGASSDTTALTIYTGQLHPDRINFEYTVTLVQGVDGPLMRISALSRQGYYMGRAESPSEAEISVPVTAQQPTELTKLTDLLGSPAFQKQERYVGAPRRWVFEKKLDKDDWYFKVGKTQNGYHTYPKISTGHNTLFRELITSIFTMEDDTIHVNKDVIPPSFTLSRHTNVPVWTVNCQPEWQLSAQPSLTSEPSIPHAPAAVISVTQHYPPVPPSLGCKLGTAAVAVAAAAWLALASGLVG